MIMKTVHGIIKDGYSKVKNDDKVMWNVVCLVSDALEPLETKEPNEYWRLLKDIHCEINGPHYDETFAEYRVDQLWFVDNEGKKHEDGHWSIGQTTDIFDRIKSRIPSEYNKWDWFVTMNMLYSDYYCLYKSWWEDLSEESMTQKIIETSINYLNDPDAGDGKIWKRLEK